MRNPSITQKLGEIVTALAIVAQAPVVGAEPFDQDTFHIRQIARGLEEAPQPFGRDFALVAIAEMVDVYTREADLARSEARRGDTRQWSIAVRRQARELTAIASSMTESTPVQVGLTRYDRVFVVVDGRLVILTNPRVDEQIVFEQRIANRFCERNLCTDLVEQARSEVASPQPAAITARWSFSDNAGPVCNAVDGLEIQFSSVSDLWWKRPACEAVSGELVHLAGQLALERGNGTRIDWNEIAIRDHPGSDLNRVILNERGDYLLLRLPALSNVPGFLELALPWLVSRTGDVPRQLVILNAESLLAPLSRGAE